ncbi:MAG: A24 family peptidase [Geodermatophilaceae bacterium]
MPVAIVILTATITALAALALSRWMRVVADTESFLLRFGLHVVLAGSGGAGAAMLARSAAELVGFSVLALACSLLVVIDIAAYRLPDIIVVPTYPLLFVALTVAAAVEDDWGRLGRAAGAAAILAVTYLILALITPSGLGLGDVKLSGLLGAFLGWLGWSHVLLGTLAAFVLSAVVALVLLILTKADRSSDFPFGPWMVAGAVLGAIFGPQVFALSS